MVYIDNFNGPFRRMLMCHMIADTTEELMMMADKIGVGRKWIQYPGTANEHFDVCLSAKKKAITFGAIEINMRDYARMVNERQAIGKFDLDNLKLCGEKTVTKIDPQASFKF
jgi:hypothetical protein